MKIGCIIVDDKPLARDILTEYINKTPFLEMKFSVANPLEALDYIYQHGTDLVFLDIQMPELSGIEFMKLLNGRSRVILQTAYAEFALEGYEHDVIDYLLKPVPFERFYKAAEKARQQISPGKLQDAESQRPQNALPLNAIFLKTDHKIEKIDLDKILYIEGRENYIAVVTKIGKTLSLLSIKNIDQQLPPEKFMRVHKSYIISLDKIESIEKSKINIEGASIPIGDSYREEFFKRIRQ